MKTPQLRITPILYKLTWLLPGPVFYLLFRLSFLWPSFTEAVYSRSIFPVTNQVLSTATGFFPFSLAEILAISLIAAIVVLFILMTIKAIKAKKNWWRCALKRMLILLSAVSIMYALFVGLWGFNYAREPLSKSLGLNASPATVNELYQTCEALLDQANALRQLVPEDENGVFAPNATRNEIMKIIPEYYNHAADMTGLDFLGGSYGRVKPLMTSEGFSWSNVAGIYIPFTGEANVNTDVPLLLFTSSAAHEAAHQRGFAREDEANFLAYYVLSFSGDASTRYSGTMLALIHATNALHKADSDLYYLLRGAYSDGVVRDLQHNSAYWAQYESALSETVTQVNNTYLKANMQADGIKSYGRMTDLLIAHWRSGGIAPVPIS